MSTSEGRVIGVRAHDYGKQPISDLCRGIAADGWKAIQLAFPKAVLGVDSFGDVTEELLKETKAVLKETKLKVAVLGVYVEPSLMDEARRWEQSDIFLNALPQAKRLRAGCVGTETTSRRKYPDSDLKSLRRTLEEWLPEAERLGVDVAVEPVHYHTLSTPEMTRELLRDMISPRLKVIFDPVNLLRQEDIANQKDLWERCLEAFGWDIAAVHIKGASAEADGNGVLRNAPLESSVVDYKSLFTLLRQVDAPLLRELAVKDTAEKDINFLRGLE